MQTHQAITVGLVIFLARHALADVVYVAAGAAGAGSGSSWNDAFTNLESALSTTPAGSELWVHAGVYGPCTLRTNTVVYGGFTGAETQRNARDWRAYPTLINGAGSRAVAFAAGATLDGFVITNTSGQGGAVLFDRVSGTLQNCRVVGHAGGDAVALVSTGGNSGAQTVVRNCEFTDGSGGSAVFYYGRTNIYTGPHPVTIDRCTFSRNHSTERGGAISTDHAGHWLRIENSVFIHNTADLSGGALYAGYSQFGPGTPVGVYNCTFYSNASPAGKAVCVSFEEARVDVQNCIVWGATNDQLRTQNSTPVLRVGYSDLEGGFASTFPRHGTITDLGGLLDGDPQFADADGADDVIGTADDDLRLTAGSPCIETGLAEVAPDHDRDGLVRPQGTRVDIGAYEFAGGPLPTGAVIQVR
ncbi:MAG: right-handed parallel beta-helix repeat-containing protein [Lentisphaerae bacterium]|nr:right-handed parallel beta-helix repeat-containing protein [Lentisphaerota bacterium]